MDWRKRVWRHRDSSRGYYADSDGGVLIKIVVVRQRKKNYLGFGIWRTNVVTDWLRWQEIART